MKAGDSVIGGGGIIGATIAYQLGTSGLPYTAETSLLLSPVTADRT